MPIDRSLKVTEPHKLHSQQWGIMCPYETPDGASIGYLKNLAILAKITAGINVDNIKKCLEDIGVIPLINSNIYSNKNITNVFVNGTLFGITGDPLFVTRLLKAYRRTGLINILISISFNITANELRIFTEAGRPCRPLLILKYNNANKKNEAVVYSKANEFKNWFDLLNGTNYALDNNEKNDDYYYIDKYINPLKARGKRKVGGSIFDNNFKTFYDTIFPANDDNLQDVGKKYEYEDDEPHIISLGNGGDTKLPIGNNHMLPNITKLHYGGGSDSSDSDEDSDCDSHKSKTNINILDNVVANINIEELLDVNNTIKIINFDEALTAITGEDINIDNDSESIDDSLGDSESESDDESDNGGEKTNNTNLTQISNDSQLFNPELLKVIDISTILDESIKEKNDSNIDYKKMSLNKLRDIIVSKKLVTDPSKLKKNEMLKLLGSE